MPPELSRRHLLGSVALAGASVYGVRYLRSGAIDAAFKSWTPAPGTWPLWRYDPGNTAHNPHANPPRERPMTRALATAVSADDPGPFPLVGTDHLALYGDGLSVYPAGGGDAIWTDDRPAHVAGFGPPEDARLYAALERETGDGYDLVGFSTNGELDRTFDAPYGSLSPFALVVGRDELYAGRGNRLIGINTESGRSWQVPGMLPALADGRLYVTGTPEGLVAYEERRGLDRRLERGPERVWSADGPYGAGNSPAVANGRVVVGAFGHPGIDSRVDRVVGYDAATGDPLWEPREFGDPSTPAVVGDRGYVAAGEGVVAALDLAAGETIWRDEIEWHNTSYPAVGGEETLMVAGDVRDQSEVTAGKVRAYDATTGEVLWTITLDDTPNSLALVDDRVLVTVGRTLYELRA